MKTNQTNKSNPVVYIIDSDLDFHSEFAKSLNTFKIPVKCYPCAESFLQDPIDTNAACLVIELNLPKLNGIELLEQLNNKGYDIPTIIVASCSDIRSAVKAMQANALDFVEKPFHHSVLMGHIKSLLGKQSASLSRFS